MATDKRSRQRANKAAKQAEEERSARRSTMFKRLRRWAFYAVLFALVIFLASRIWGGGDEQALGLLAGA